MSERLPEHPEPRRSRAWLWALVPVVLGLMVLVGGAVAGLLFALRGSGAASSGATSAAPRAAAAPAAPPPLLAPPSVAMPAAPEPDPGVDADSAREASVPSALPASAPGPRTHALDATVLLPVSGGAALWGVAEAPVTVALFGDLGCPHTRVALRRVVGLAARLGPRVRLVFYHRPVDDRPFSVNAARVLAAVALRAGPDAAWRALNEAASSTTSEEGELERWLTVAGVETAPAALAREPAALARVHDDTELGLLLDVQATPTLFINGRRLLGAPAEATLERYVDEESRAVRWMREQGVPPARVYARRVRKNLIGVDEGAANRACVPVDKAPVLGAPEALVTVVEFSDFECRHCRALEPALSAVMARYPGLVRRVWRSFALPQHHNARRAAAFALAARELGGERAFWAVHAALLAGSSDALGDDRLRALAGRLGLDGARLLALSDEPRRASELEQDHELARSLGLEGAPTLFINGRQIAGAVPVAALDGVIREELEAARRVVRGGTPPAGFEGLLCGG